MFLVRKSSRKTNVQFFFSAALECDGHSGEEYIRAGREGDGAEGQRVTQLANGVAAPWPQSGAPSAT